MAKGYWIALYREIRDPDKLAAYAELAGVAIQAGGGRFLARGGAVQAYEQGLEERAVLIEFPSYEAAVATYEGDGYQEALKRLGDAADRDLRIVEGLD
jgi:uncharacterized protein (DUF1330 family)